MARAALRLLGAGMVLGVSALPAAASHLPHFPQSNGDEDGPQVATYGCGANPAGSLIVLAGEPAIGRTLQVGIDNPRGTQAAGSIPLLYLALRADPWYPCGKLLPGFGQGGPGASGELLLDLSTVFLRMTGTPWKGTGEPVPFAIEIPSDPSLVGLEFRAQGVLVDMSATYGVRFGLTEALHARIGG